MGLRATLQLVENDARLALQTGDHDTFFSFIYPDERHPQWVDKEPADLDRAWHLIHFLVTGDTSTTLLLNGVQVDGIEEHLEFHPSEAVAELSRTLKGKSAEELLSTVSMRDVNKVGLYDANWDESALPYLHEKLSAFLRKIVEAEATNRGLFISIM